VEPAAVLVVAFQVQVGLGPFSWPAPACEPFSTSVWVVPESNQTSRMSALLV
jgi:hypothetical protein